MRKLIYLIVSIFFILNSLNTYAQDNKQIALDKAKRALKLEDDGKYDQAIQLLGESQKLDPDNINYPYELAYAYYVKKDYSTSCKYLEPLLNHKDAIDLVYQLLGNCYDVLDYTDKAVETYQQGLEKFPNSGSLYLELSVIKIHKKEYFEALKYNEKGIEVSPTFPSNYYWAAKIFCSTSEKVWGMFYGEIFMNLERNTERTQEISKLLFDTYKNNIVINYDTSFNISFSQNALINIEKEDKIDKLKIPFGVGIYEPILIRCVITEKNIDLNSLDRIRQNFLKYYFDGENNKNYPNVLFEYQNKIQQAGHLEAYNHWLLMMGDIVKFEKWQSDNKEKWDSFVKWFINNPININENNKFHRFQYLFD